VKRAVLLLSLLAAAGCPPPKQVDIPVECIQEERVAEVDLNGESGTGVAWLGGIRLLERVDRKNGVTQGTLGASFYDVSGFRTEYGDPLDFGATCIGITGQPSQTGMRSALSVDSVQVDGISNGPVTLSAADGGPLSLGPLPTLYAGGPVTVTVAGTDGGFGNVAFSPLTPPTRIDVTEPDLSGSFKVGDEGLTLKWAPAEGSTQLGIDLVVGSTVTDRAVISCVVKDDGCFKVEQVLVDWLRGGGSGAPISVFLRRSVAETRLVESPVDGGAGASVQLTSEIKGEVQP